MAQLGFRKFDDMVGRVDRLKMRDAIEHYKAKGLDFSAIFHRAENSYNKSICSVPKKSEGLKDHLDWQILEMAKPALEKKEKTIIEAACA